MSREAVTDAEFMLDWVRADRERFRRMMELHLPIGEPDFPYEAQLDALEALAKIPCLDEEECGGFDGMMCKRCQALRQFRQAMEEK